VGRRGRVDASLRAPPAGLRPGERLGALPLPDGASLKVVEPPPGPPVLSTLLAEIYGPDPETRRAVAAKVRESFESVPFVVDVDDSYGRQAKRVRVGIDQDNLEYYKVEQSDVYDTIRALYSANTVGYSHRGGGRQPIPIVLALSKGDKTLDEKTLTTPVPANALPGERSVVELGDVVKVAREEASYPIFRHNGRAAEMVMAELAGEYEAPIYGMLAVSDLIDKTDWGDLPKPEVSLHGQPLSEKTPVLLWDGEWEITYVTFRDMGAAFMVAIVGIYILVVAQFGSFKLPLVILTPIPLTLIGIVLGHWHAQAAVTDVHAKAYRIAAAEFETALAELRDLEDELVAFERGVERSLLPWTPGRIPDWRPE